jgi:Uma2 family endonuclease
MKKRSANFHMRRSLIISELLRDLFQAELGRHGSMISCAVRPDRYSELIVHLCMYQPEVRDRYPNADEVYLAVDVYDHHSPELRQARMRKLLNAGLAEYWDLDIVKQTLNAYRNSFGRIIQTEYGPGAKVPLDSFPGVEIDLSEVFSQVAPVEQE